MPGLDNHLVQLYTKYFLSGFINVLFLSVATCGSLGIYGYIIYLLINNNLFYFLIIPGIGILLNFVRLFFNIYYILWFGLIFTGLIAYPVLSKFNGLHFGAEIAIVIIINLLLLLLEIKVYFVKKDFNTVKKAVNNYIEV